MSARISLALGVVVGLALAGCTAPNGEDSVEASSDVGPPFMVHLKVMNLDDLYSENGTLAIVQLKSYEAHPSVRAGLHVTDGLHANRSLGHDGPVQANQTIEMTYRVKATGVGNWSIRAWSAAWMAVLPDGTVPLNAGRYFPAAEIFLHGDGEHVSEIPRPNHRNPRPADWRPHFSADLTATPREPGGTLFDVKLRVESSRDLPNSTVVLVVRPHELVKGEARQPAQVLADSPTTFEYVVRGDPDAKPDHMTIEGEFWTDPAVYWGGSVRDEATLFAS